MNHRKFFLECGDNRFRVIHTQRRLRHIGQPIRLRHFKLLHIAHILHQIHLFDTPAGAFHFRVPGMANQHHVAATPILAVAGPWLYLRVRFFRRKWTVITLASTPAGEQLLALRALANRPLGKLAAVSMDPVGAWRRQDPAAVRGLAALELRSAGIRASNIRPASFGSP